VADDPIDRLRLEALQGLPAAPRYLPVRRVRPDPGPPPLPEDAVTSTVEQLPAVLLEGATRAWRRCAQTWAPSLDRLPSLGVAQVRVSGRTLEVRVRNATYRARHVELVWVPVLVAALTGDELPGVRRALRRGTTLFLPVNP
jgi:hypothetical protein